ncbi:MAG: DUF4389 domain-containing protein [SAR202 cluster bacterium]|nr:DUF4389 domain-containing protein [SAR202 cluster bacterium]
MIQQPTLPPSGQPAPPPYPVDITISYPERRSRGVLLLKVSLGWLILVPHFVLLYVLGIMTAIITFLAFFIVLFTGQYPRGMFDFMVGYYRWSMRVSAYASLLRDEYPPFRLAP